VEISDVRRQVTQAMERARRSAADRRARNDEASKEFDVFLSEQAVPLFRQVANVLRTLGYPFTVFTPGGSVRLMSDKSADDFIELFLDTTGEEALVMGHASRHRGRRVIESERPIGSGPVRDLSEETVLQFLLGELESYVER